jgi:hypothetical protein
MAIFLHAAVFSRCTTCNARSNNSACATRNVLTYARTSRHVKTRLKFVRKLRYSRVVALEYFHTTKNLADQFTKGLSCNVVDYASMELDLRPMKVYP